MNQDPSWMAEIQQVMGAKAELQVCVAALKRLEGQATDNADLENAIQQITSSIEHQEKLYLDALLVAIVENNVTA